MRRGGRWEWRRTRAARCGGRNAEVPLCLWSDGCPSPGPFVSLIAFPLWEDTFPWSPSIHRDLVNSITTQVLSSL